METAKEIIDLISNSDSPVIAILVLIICYQGWRLHTTDKKREEESKKWLDVNLLLKLKSMEADKKLDEIKSIVDRVLERLSR